MDYQIADAQDYEIANEQYKKDTSNIQVADDINEGDQACRDQDSLVEASEHAFSEWQDSFSDDQGRNTYE